MKVLALILALAIPLNSYALEPQSVREAVTTVSRDFEHPEILEVAQGIQKIARIRNISISQRDIYRLSVAILHAQDVSGVDWHYILAITVIETNMCQYRLVGDKKQGYDGSSLYHWWSVGCMQVNTRWWGATLHRAGISQQQMLDFKTGITVGSLILKKYVDQYGEFHGIKRYNGTGKMADRYRTKVYQVIALLK